MTDAAGGETTLRPPTGQIILKNTVIVTAGLFALKLLNFLYSIYVVRRLGDERLGQYATVLAWVGVFQIFAELGMSQFVMREIAQDHRKAPQLFWNLVSVRLLLALIGIVGITAGAAAVGYSQALVLGVFFSTWTFVLSAIEVPLETVLTAHERLDYTTGLFILIQIVGDILGVVVLWLDMGFLALIIMGLVAMVPQIIAAIWLVRRHGFLKGPVQLTPRRWPALVRAGLPFGFISLALTITFSIDTVILSRFVAAREVGWYNVAYNLVRSLVGFLSAFSMAMVPSLSRTYVKEAAQVERWYYRSVKFILLISLPLAVGGMLSAYSMVRFLYTPDYLPSALALQILIWDVPLLMFAAFCGNMTTVISAEHMAARIYGLSAVANVALNLYAIPKFGMVGASLVTLVTDLVAALQFYVLLRHRLHMPNMTSTLLRLGLASAALGAVLRLAGDRQFLLLLGLGGVAYVILVLALRLLDAEDWALLRRLWPFRNKALREGV